MASEKAPLLGAENSSGYTSPSGIQPTAPDLSVTVPPIGPDELPPPYTGPTQQGGMFMISCRVCGVMIDITGKRDQHVVKCSSCNEATPIKNAPPGKKYVPCPCNCLLICKSTSQKIACPRPNCKRIINLTPNAATIVPGMCQISCAHCHNLFIFNTLNNALARCPHCRHVSSVGGQFSRNRATRYAVKAAVLLFISIVITVSIVTAQLSPGIYAIPFVGFVLTLVCLGFCVYHCTMKVSVIEGPV